MAPNPPPALIKYGSVTWTITAVSPVCTNLTRLHHICVRVRPTSCFLFANAVRGPGTLQVGAHNSSLKKEKSYLAWPSDTRRVSPCKIMTEEILHTSWNRRFFAVF